MPACFARTLAACAVLLGLSFPAHAAKNYGDEQFRLEHGHDGKDVFWAPTPDAMVTLMLKAAQVTAADIVYDLGAGEGRIPITAAREFGARAVGIEYTPEVADLARRNVQRAGVADRVKIITGDIFVEDFSEATVVTFFLTPVLNKRLRPLLMKMRPGTRLVSHGFDMGDWAPDMRLAAGRDDAFLWIVPAPAEGEWSLRLPGLPQPATLQLKQTWQQLAGTLTLDGQATPIENARLRGAEMRFDWRQPDGTLASIVGKIEGGRFTGRQTHPQAAGEIVGERR